jgi:hypothetical protein
MKKILLITSMCLSSLFAQSPVSYTDLYGEVQMNMIIAEKCLEEIAYTRKTNGQQCANYTKYVNANIYKNLLNAKFSSYNTAGTFWTDKDLIILQNQMKKLIYTYDMVQQFK